MYVGGHRFEGRRICHCDLVAVLNVRNTARTMFALIANRYTQETAGFYVRALKMLDVKMTDVKLTDQCARHEIAGIRTKAHSLGQKPIGQKPIGQKPTRT